MVRTATACFSLFRLKTAEALQYRVAALTGAANSIVWGLIMITVYTVFYTHAQSGGGGTPLSLPQMISYVWLGQALWSLASFSAIDGEIQARLTAGDVGVELCRPLDLYFHWFAKNSAGRLGVLLWRAFFTVLIAVLIPGGWGLCAPASAAGFILFVCSAVSAFFLSASYAMLIIAVRLGVTWGDGPMYILQLLGLVLSGGYLPLQLWPDFLQTFLYWQPFAGSLDLPLRLYVGSMRPKEAVGAILLQLGWTLAFILAGRFVMRRKLRNIIVQGG